MGADSFQELEDQLDALDEQGVPDGWVDGFRKVRSELKNRRERWKPYEDAFGGLPETDREVLLEVARVLPENPTAVAKWMVDTARELGGEQFGEWVGAEQAAALEKEQADMNPVEPDENPDEGKSIDELVAEKVAAALADRDKQSAEEKAIAEQHKVIEDTLRNLGYTDPASPDAQLVLFRARELGGDPLDAIQKAHDGLDDFFAERAQKYVESKSADADTPAPPVGEVPDVHQEPEGTTPEDRMKARLDSVFAADTSAAT